MPVPKNPQIVISMAQDNVRPLLAGLNFRLCHLEIISRPIIPISTSIFSKNQTENFGDFHGEIIFDNIVPVGLINSSFNVCSKPGDLPPIPCASMDFTEALILLCPKKLAYLAGIQV